MNFNGLSGFLLETPLRGELATRIRVYSCSFVVPSSTDRSSSLNCYERNNEMKENEISAMMIGGAIKSHRQLEPG